MKINIVYALTRNYYHKILPSLRSLAEHHPDARVFVLAEDDELPFETPQKLEVINVAGQTYFPKNGPNYNNAFTYINLLKDCYPSLLPVNKVIHLDVDTIICDSLEGIWRTDVTGKWVAAVQEYRGKFKPFGPVYYNMGVAMYNLAQMRKDRAEELMVQHLNSAWHPYPDQDAINLFGLEQGKFVDLEIRYNENMMTGYTDSPAIVHYCAIWNWYESKDMPRVEYLAKYK